MITLVTETDPIPRSNDALSDQHFDLAGELEARTVAVFDAVAHAYGEKAAHEAVKAMLLASFGLREADIARFDEIGWCEYIATEAQNAITSSTARLLCEMQPSTHGKEFLRAIPRRSTLRSASGASGL